MPLEPGMEIELKAGEAVVCLENAAGSSVRNTSDVPAVVLTSVANFRYAGDPPSAEPVGVESTDMGAVHADQWAALPPGPLIVVTERVSLAPGSALEPVPVVAEAPDLIVVEAGQLEVAVLPAGETVPTGRPLRFREGQAVPFAPLPEGARLQLQNGSDEPVSILRLSIRGVGDAIATPAAAAPPRV